MAAAPPHFNTSDRLFDHEHQLPDHKRKVCDEKERDLDSGESEIDLEGSDIDLGESEADSEDEVSFDIVPGKCLIPEQRRGPYQLFEMFSVIMKGVEEEHLSGYIRIIGGFGRLDLFKRENPEKEDITVFKNKDGDMELLLTGPTTYSFIAGDPVVVYMNIKNVKNDISCQDAFGFNAITRNGYEFYNTLLSATISPKGLGSITFNYAAFDSPISAKVEVLVDNTINSVFGEIYAKNSVHRIRTCLFYKEEETPCVLPNNDGSHLSIPLSKSVVALPNIADLIIEMDLTDSNTGLSVVKDEVVFQIPALEEVFTRRNFRFSQIVSSNIRVNVNLASYHY